jgi:hypothetical protein
MSHVEAMTGTAFADLSLLSIAAQAMGAELVKDVSTYKWYGVHVGDYPIPAGFSKEELGKCEHVIRIPDCRYEIGVVQSKDPDNPGWVLLYDFWGPGKKLEEWLGGSSCHRLRESYTDQAVRRVAKNKKAKSVSKQKFTNEKNEEVAVYAVTLS